MDSIINNVEGIVNITPIGDAPTYVNGNLITEPTILHHVSAVCLPPPLSNKRYFVVGNYICWLFPYMQGFNFSPAHCFLHMEISSGTPISTLVQGSGHSGSASWDDCGWVFCNKLYVNMFPWWVSMQCLDSMISPLQLHRAKGACMFSCNPPSAALAQWPGSYVCYCGNKGVKWILTKESAQKVNFGVEILPIL